MKTKKFWRGFLLSLAFFVLFYVAQFAGGIIVSVVAMLLGADPMSGPVQMFSMYGGSILTFVIAPLFYKIIKKSALPPLEINRVKPATAIIAVIAGILSSTFTQSGLALLPVSQEMIDQQVDTFSFIDSVPLFVTILAIGVLAPIGEELFFRGGIFQTMRRDSNAFVASIVSAAMFSLAHFPVVRQMAYTVALGLIWALICHFTKSILPCIIVHVINNSWLALLPDSVGVSALNIITGSYAWAVFAISAALIAGCIYLMARLEKSREWKVLTGGRNSQPVPQQ